MTYFSRLVGFTASFFLLLSSASAKELEDEKWLEVSTDNFTIRSTLGKRKTVDLIRQLEVLRAAVPLLTNTDKIESAIPTHIYALSRASDFDAFGINRDYVGLYRNRLRNNTIFIRDMPHMDEASVILHEYVHFMMHTHSAAAYPRWYHEGYAEYLGSLQVNRDDFLVGASPEGRVFRILDRRWLTAEQMMDPEEFAGLSRNQLGMFYAQSWALVHYLTHRKDRETTFGQDMRSYLNLVAQGNSEVTAFTNAFGVAPDELTSKLKSYLRYKCCDVFGYKIDQLQFEFEPQVRTMGKNEISLGLAQAALSVGAYDSATRWYQIAAELEETRAAAEAGLGDMLKFKGEYDAAQPHFELAEELGADDPYVQLDVGEFWLDKASEATDPEEQHALARKARQKFVRAWKLDPAIPETYVMNGRAYLLEGNSEDKAVQMFEEAEYLYPANLTIRMDLANAYALVGRNADAVRTAQVILSWGHGNDRPAEFAKELIERLSGEGVAKVSDAP